MKKLPGEMRTNDMPAGPETGTPPAETRDAAPKQTTDKRIIMMTAISVDLCSLGGCISDYLI